MKENNNLENNDVKSIYDILKSFFNNDYEINNWLNSPNPNFGNTSPQVLIDNGMAYKVKQWIEACMEGY